MTTTAPEFPSANIPTSQNDAVPPSPAAGDPRLATLIAMFPTFDPAVMEGVLDACGGDQERAIDQLLGMSDPNHVPEALPESRANDQTALDEELARRLMLEDEAQNNRSQAAPPESFDQRHSLDGYSVPYQPRVRPANRRSQDGYYSDGQYEHVTADQPSVSGFGHSNTWQSHSPRPSGGNSDFQDQFNKFAETGRKTFSSIVSKVKEKFREFENPSNQPAQGSSGRNHWSSWQGSVGPQQAAPQEHQFQQWNQGNPSRYDEPPWNTNTQSSSTQYPTNFQTSPTSAQPAPSSNLTHLPRTEVAQGYDVESAYRPAISIDVEPESLPNPRPAVSSQVESPNSANKSNNPFLSQHDPPSSMPAPALPASSTQSVTGLPGVTTPTRMPSPQPIGSPTGTANTSSPPPLDRAKLGLLPKRPVSLKGPTTTTQSQPQRDESLEYVDNPFEHH